MMPLNCDESPVLPNGWKRQLVGLAVLCACVVFVIRGPYRAVTNDGLNDLLSPYIQSSALLHGKDPYSCQSLFSYWPPQGLRFRPDARQFVDGSILVRHGIPTAYPITSLFLLASLTWMPWPVFQLLILAATLLLFGAAVLALAALTNMSRVQRAGFVVFALIFAPLHTGIATCNLAVLAVEVGVLALWAEKVRKPFLSGVLIAICVGLKPPLGLCFLLYYVVKGSWRIAGVAVGSLAIIGIVPILWLSLHHAPWVSNYAADNRALLENGTLGDFTEKNPLRFGLVNLQVAAYPFVHERNATNLLVGVICGSLLVVWLALALKIKPRDEFACLSALAVLTLLCVYHRFYDASLLIIPVSWLFAKARSDRIAALGLAISAAFLVPGGTLLQNLHLKGHLFPGIERSNLGQSFVMAHAAWCSVMLVSLLLYRMAVPSPTVSRDEPPRPWMKHFGKLKHLHKENERLNKRVEDAFEKIDQEIWK
jgi:hypothetical protein